MKYFYWSIIIAAAILLASTTQAATILFPSGGGTGSSTLSGILKGNGASAVRTAVSGTDYQAPLTLTTSGTSGAASFDGATLNIPQYSGGSSSWGSITGTLSAQTDLQTALNAKADTLSLALVATSGDAGDLTGALSVLHGGTGNTDDIPAGSLLVGQGIGQPMSILNPSTSDGDVLTISGGVPTWLLPPLPPTSGSIGTFGDGTLSLYNDQDTPGNSYYYGTDVTGMKGWWALPTAGDSLTADYPLTGLGTSGSHLGLAFGTTTANSWNSLQQFNGSASTTLFSSYGPAYFGATATSSFSSAGVLTLVSPLAIGSGGTGATTQTTNGVNFYNGSAITSSANLKWDGTVLAFGGTTASTWTSYSGVIEGGGASQFYGTGGDIWTTSNGYFNAGWKYKTTAAASNIGLYQGEVWERVAPSGTINNALTWVMPFKASYSSGGIVGLGGDITTTANSLTGATLTVSPTAVTITTLGSGLLKTTSGVISNASNGADYTLLTAQSCTNQVITALTAAGGSTCSSVSNAMLSNSTISGIALGGSLFAHTHNATLSGTSYNGSAAVSDWGLNLANANSWTALQSFANASSTIFSVTNKAYFGGLATSTFDVNGSLSLAGVLTVSTTTATSTFAGGLQAATSYFSGLVEFAGNVLARAGTILDFSNATVKIHQYPAFSYATSTAWTGTTTIPLGPAYTLETWKGVKCFTDVGTVNVSFNDGTNRMDMFNASTTIGTIGFTTNNALSAGTKRYVDIGTPASTPTKISCTVDKIINQ